MDLGQIHQGRETEAGRGCLETPLQRASHGHNPLPWTDGRGKRKKLHLVTSLRTVLQHLVPLPRVNTEAGFLV